MKKIELFAIMIFSFVILSGCGAQENNKPSNAQYSEKEISEIRNEIIDSFKNAYEKDITKDLPFSIAQGALCFAVEKKKISEIDRALFNGADINFIYQDIMELTFSPLYDTIMRGHESKDKEFFRIFLHLISRGADISEVDKKKDSALIIAAKYSNKEVFDYLLDKKVNVNYKNINNENVLTNASMIGDLYFVKKLLDLGIEVNVRSTDHRDEGWTCLDTAIFNHRIKPDQVNQGIVDILRKYGAKTGAELDAELRK